MAAVKDIISSPTQHFDHPIDVLVDDRLTTPEKKKTLQTWEEDETALDRSSDDGMLPEVEEPSIRRDLKVALKAVDKNEPGDK